MFTQLASNIKGFARKSASASCVLSRLVHEEVVDGELLCALGRTQAAVRVSVPLTHHVQVVQERVLRHLHAPPKLNVLLGHHSKAKLQKGKH